MSNLTWSGNDGFDQCDVRMASVVRCFENAASHAAQGGGHSGPGFFAPRSYWEAFIARDRQFDHVLVDGRPGRWGNKDEAKAASEAAHRAWVTASGDEPASTSGSTPSRGRSQEVNGVLGHLRSLARAWRAASRPDRGTRAD